MCADDENETMGRGLKWLSAVTVTLLVGAGVVAWQLPAWLQPQLESQASQALGREVRLQSLEWAGHGLGLTLRGLSVAAAAGAATSAQAPDGTAAAPAAQLEVDRVQLQLAWGSIAARAPVIESLEIDAPRLRLTRQADGGLDVDDIVRRLTAGPARPAGAAPPRFELRNLKVQGGRLEVDDRVVSRQHRLEAITLVLPRIGTLGDPGEAVAEPALDFSLDGVPVEIRARVQPFASDRPTVLTARLQGLGLDRWWAYLPAGLPWRLAGGVLDTRLSAEAALPPAGPARIALRGDVALGDLELRTASGEPLAGWKRLELNLAELRPGERIARFGSVRLEAPRVALRRRADGRIDFGMPPPPAAPPATGPAADGAATPPWQLGIERLELADGTASWTDATLRPATRVVASELQVSAESVRWPMTAPAPVRASTRLAADGRPLAGLQASGEASDRSGTIAIDLSGLELQALQPYLRRVLGAAVSGRLEARGSVSWTVEQRARLVAQLQSLSARRLQLTEPGATQPAVQLRSLSVGPTTVDLAARRAQLGSVRLEAPSVELRRDADGALNAAAWFQPPAGAASPDRPGPKPAGRAGPAPAAAPEWVVGVHSIRIADGRLRWRDALAGRVAAAPPPASAPAPSPRELQLDVRSASLQGLTWPPQGRAAQVQLAASTPSGRDGIPDGSLQARAAVQLAPLAARGTLQASRLPVQALEPYFGAALPFELVRAELGLDSEFDLRQLPQGLRLRSRGKLLLADLLVNSRVAARDVGVGDELLSWQSLALEPLAIDLEPGRKPSIDIGQLLLSDVYSRLVVTEDGRLNLVERREPSAAAPADASTPLQAPDRTGAGEAAGAQAGRAELPVDITVGETRLVRGRIDFNDRFIRPNYSAALTELEGRLGRFSSTSDELPALDIRGRAAGTATLEIRGTVNPTARPLVLDLSARATDLELAPLSPYAGKYAGYTIDRGKLSVDLAYKIDLDGRLEARNQVILNQLTFGQKIDSPSATSLPVRLAVALLSDRNGVIDVNLPVSGSINDPQFSVFGLLLRVLGNLVVKAVTAPFALFAGGGDEDLSTVEFVPGSNRLSPSAGATLERVGQALKDRPALRMTVVGAADPVSEREAIQAQTLEDRLRAEQRRDLARAGKAVASGAELPALSADERARLLKRLYDDARLPDKPRNLIGLSKALPPAEMEAMLARAILVSSDTARELAIQRGLAVREALVARGLPAERLFLGAPRVRVPAEDDGPWSPRVQLSLSAP